MFFSMPARAEGEILIKNISLEELPPFQYKVKGLVSNNTGQAREVVLRGEVVVYDRSAPKGDVPVRVLRRDSTIVLKAREKRIVTLDFLLEGRMPDVPLRNQPVLRVRRQKPWNYEASQK